MTCTSLGTSGRSLERTRCPRDRLMQSAVGQSQYVGPLAWPSCCCSLTGAGSPSSQYQLSDGSVAAPAASPYLQKRGRLNVVAVS